MRGNLPLNFFESIQDYLYNWGFQYFLASFLNQNVSGGIVRKMIEMLSEIHKVNFSDSLNEYYFHISGLDSSLSENLSSHFTAIFPPEIKDAKSNIRTIIDKSDLCLILRNPITNEKVGIFGEVEGLHGNKLKLESYWKNKQDSCVFSFGVVNGSNKQCFVEPIHVGGVERVGVFFERTHFVVDDFNLVISQLKLLFVHGPRERLSRGDEEFDYFINMFVRYWNRPVVELLEELRKFIDGRDLVGQMPEKLSIITSLQA